MTLDTNPAVDFYFTNPGNWQAEMALLRKIVLGCGLKEELKWGCPCYTWEQHNIVLIHQFKNYCALLFFKGALLKDTNQILVQQTKNVQAARQARFTTVAGITSSQASLKAYVFEAIETEKAGLKVELLTAKDLEMPAEFQEQLDKNGKLKKAFEALTPGRQRAYYLHFSGAKQSATRKARVLRYIPHILDGKGLND